MARTMLQVRIDALCDHLEQAQESHVWKQRLDLTSFDVDNELWTDAVEEIYRVAVELRARLGGIRDDLARGKISESHAWRDYERVQVVSEDVFRECLDLLGGLALRDRTQDEQVCRIADEYIKELASVTVRHDSFAIPGIDARLASTLRRVAKMQFPEWTVWTIPLVAHEYGHVVIEKSGFRNYAATLAARFAEKSILHDYENVVAALKEGADLGDAIQRAAAGLNFSDLFLAGNPEVLGGAERRSPGEVLGDVLDVQSKRARILLADAVATLLAGPAYACAALLLRLNPLPDRRQSDGGQPVSDHDRAATILSVLKYMDTPAANAPNALGEIVNWLSEYWHQSVAAACGAVFDPDTNNRDSVALIDPAEIHQEFRANLASHFRALYVSKHSSKAIAWSSDWVTDHGNDISFRLHPIDPDERICEPLNAAWRTRIKLTRDLEPKHSAEAAKRIDGLATAALAQCDAVIAQLKAKRDGSGGNTLGRVKRP